MISLLAIMAAATATAAATPAMSASSPTAEMALRCSVVENAPLFARNAPTLSGPLSGGPAPAPIMKPMPQMMVDGWKVDNLPIGEAIGQLAADGGFTVEAEEGLRPVSWNGIPTPLGDVVAKLAQLSGGVPSFDGKVLKIAKPTPPSPWRFQRPAGRDATLALLDALRGYGAKEVKLTPDAITFQASSQVVERIRKGLSGATSVVAFDVWSYQVKTAKPDWKKLEDIAPVSERHPFGTGGRFVTSYMGADKFAELLGGMGETRELGSQTVAGPQGWSMEVPLAQCGTSPQKLTPAMLKPVWDGKSMSVEVMGTSLAAGRIDALPPGSTAVVASPATGEWTTVALIRPRILSSK